MFIWAPEEEGPWPPGAASRRKLIDSIRYATVVEDPSALAEFDIRPTGFREAIATALRSEVRGSLSLNPAVPCAATRHLLRPQ